MIKWTVVFDGSTFPATVTLTDGVSDARARFEDEDEAREFYYLLHDLKKGYEAEYQRVARVKQRIQEALRESVL